MHRLMHACNHAGLEKDVRTMRAFCLAAFQMLLERVTNCGSLPEEKIRLSPPLRVVISEVILFKNN